MNNEQNLYIEDVQELKDEDSIQLVGFKLGDEEYAIDVLKIQEIIRLIEITSVPRMDSYILGVINLRGKVIPVVDLRVRFELDKSDFDKKTRIIVVKFEKENIGFVVDEVTEVIRIDKSIVEPTPPLVGAVGQEYILGICKYLKRLIILLDIDRVVYNDDNLTSDLRKKIVKSQGQVEDLNEYEESDENFTEVSDTVEASELSAVSEVNSEIEKEEEEISVASESVDSEEENQTDMIDDIDKLIAMELEKREKETEELLKKKKEEKLNSSNNDVEDILNDALTQANSTISPEATHVDQDDLDRLIAEELAKREKETEELLKRKKEEEKKKIIDVGEEDVSTVAQEQLVENESADSQKNEIIIERDSLQELKSLANKIIRGEAKEIDINIKGEIGELLKLIFETKQKIDNVEPSVADSNKDVPHIAKSLENVNEYTEEATINLMEAADKMSNFFAELNEKMGNIEKVIQKGDVEKFDELIDSVEDKLKSAEELGFNILQALEFQDITEQKARKVIKKIEEIGVRLGTILGYAKIQAADSISEDTSSQEEIDKLLGEFGLG
ncbi:chemotaxis protein CheW [Deferribacterales bacterium Es71-Z0220]|uniref:chemotaxis protein CheW n=1 Tax=Deferrivibrio essentukiensis TaxID=2880922 RepID=UPI001F61D8F6|nr:chemotaxis protein CheW [Deferrivibrio essentukiensis]MCB4204716.1 chemotaxis protein CheW [Deferrivibrio essentukiensis]